VTPPTQEPDRDLDLPRALTELCQELRGLRRDLVRPVVEPALTVKDVCAAMRISRSQFWRLHRMGGLPIAPLEPALDSTLRFAPGEVRAYVERQSRRHSTSLRRAR